MLGGLTAASVGAWYYLNMSGEDVHAKRQKDVDEAAQKAKELGDAGKRTAQDFVKEGEKGYVDLKVRSMYPCSHCIPLNDFRIRGTGRRQGETP